jgi:hypothetical protein
MQAEGKRHIADGTKYDKYFEKPLGSYDITHKSGAEVTDSVNLMKTVIYECYPQCNKISKVLKGKDIKSTCNNIWNFVYGNIQYKLDKVGDEIREPIRTWADRKSGVDCDCYSVFISCILMNLGIAHKLRMTAYKADWQHIYVVAIDEQGREIIIDCVTDRFNYEVPYSNKKDFNMQLARLGNLPAQADSLSKISKQDFLSMFENNLENIAYKTSLLPFVPNGNKAYNALLQVFAKLGGTKSEFDNAILVGKRKPAQALEGLGFAALIAAALPAVSGLVDSFTGNSRGIETEKSYQAEALRDAQIAQASAQAQIAQSQAQVEQAKIDANKENTKILVLGGVGAAALIAVAFAVSGGSKGSSSSKPRKRKGLRGTPTHKGFKPIYTKV